MESLSEWIPIAMLCDWAGESSSSCIAAPGLPALPGLPWGWCIIYFTLSY